MPVPDYGIPEWVGLEGTSEGRAVQPRYLRLLVHYLEQRLCIAALFFRKILLLLRFLFFLSSILQLGCEHFLSFDSKLLSNFFSCEAAGNLSSIPLALKPFDETKLNFVSTSKISSNSGPLYSKCLFYSEK